MELSDQLLLILAGRLWRLEQLRQMIANDSFPLRHLHRMYLIFSGNLPTVLMPINASSPTLALKAPVYRLRLVVLLMALLFFHLQQNLKSLT